MAATLAFDVYGTLIDTHGVFVSLKKQIGNEASAFSSMWREKQLEYSFRRGLMQNYKDFSVCTRNALDYTNSYFGSPLGPEDREKLMAAYRELPAFPDVEKGLALAKKTGCRLFAFSNGAAEAVEALLKNAGIINYFTGIVSTDEVKSFKPNPGVYCHFLRQAGVAGNDAWLISGNPFDVIGAVSAGMRAAWVKRSPDAVFDPWGIEPTLTVNDLTQLAEQIGSR